LAKTVGQQVAEFALTMRDLWRAQGRRNEQHDADIAKLVAEVAALRRDVDAVGGNLSGVTDELKGQRRE